MSTDRPFDAVQLQILANIREAEPLRCPDCFPQIDVVPRDGRWVEQITHSSDCSEIALMLLGRDPRNALYDPPNKETQMPTTTSPVDLHAELDRFVTAVRTALDETTTEHLDLAPAKTRLAAAAKSAGHDPAALLHRADALAAAVESTVKIGMTTSDAATSARRVELPQLMLAALRYANAGDTDAAAVARAEQDVAAVQAELTDSRAQLEAAVVSGDLEIVLQLRTAVHVTLPRRITDARVALLALQLRQADAVAVAATARAEQAGAVESSARNRLDRAKAEVDSAQAQLQSAGQDVVLHAGVAEQARAEVLALAGTRDALLADHTTDRERQIRRLAGLDGQ